MENKDTVLNEEQKLAEEKAADTQEITDEMMEDVDGGTYIFSTIKSKLSKALKKKDQDSQQ